MKNIINTLLITGIFFSSPVCAMEPEALSIDTNVENQIQEACWLLQLPGDVINHIIGYCGPMEKDLLMKACQSLHKHLQNKEAILLANPSSVTLSHKIKKMFEYTNSGDAKKLKAWLSLLDAADVNKLNDDEVTSLWIASEKGLTDIVQLLLNAGADVNKIYESIPTPLVVAACEGHVKIAQLLLNAGADVNKAHNGYTPLSMASQQGHIDIVQLLLQVGADANPNGCLSLHEAVLHNHVAIVQLLLTQVKVDVNQTDILGTSLRMASTRGYTKMIRLLLSIDGINANQENPLINTLYYGCGDDKVVSLLLTTDGINVNQADDYGWAPLHYASYYGNTKIVRSLLQAGVNIHSTVMSSDAHCIVDYWISAIEPWVKPGDTALQIAQKRGHADIVALIEKHLQHEETTGNSLLHLQQMETKSKV